MEDDCYVELNYKKTNYPSIYSLDSSNSIIYVGSFSKIIGPGIRMGYIVAPDAILDKLRIVKSGGGVNQFAAIAIHRYATSTLNKDIVIRNDILKVKRDAMLQALTKYFNFLTTVGLGILVISEIDIAFTPLSSIPCTDV